MVVALGLWLNYNQNEMSFYKDIHPVPVDEASEFWKKLTHLKPEIDFKEKAVVLAFSDTPEHAAKVTEKVEECAQRLYDQKYMYIVFFKDFAETKNLTAEAQSLGLLSQQSNNGIAIINPYREWVKFFSWDDPHYSKVCNILSQVVTNKKTYDYLSKKTPAGKNLKSLR